METSVSTPALSVCIATRDRAPVLARLLDSLHRAQEVAPGLAEIVLVDNGSTDGTAPLLQSWVDRASGRTLLVEPHPGKSRAVNRALSVARAPLLAFTDDDVEVPPDWLRSIVAFFEAHPDFDAAMGRVRLPATAAADPTVVDLVTRYRTIPLFDKGDAVCTVSELYGCNMVVRRAVFERVGVFNEQLGPGASGLYEDLDLARRIVAAGLRIGYMPTVVVTHEVDPTRLTPEYLRTFQMRLGRSALTVSPGGYWRHAARLVESAAILGWSRLRGDERRRVQAWGRMLRHADALRWGWQQMRRRDRRDT